MVLRSRGHWVAHYGHADSVVDADEKVSVTDDDLLAASYPGHDWRTGGFPKYGLGDPVYKAFYANSIHQIARRKRRGDFLLLTFGANHKPVAEAHSDMIVCESGIGYPDGGWTHFRVFESYAVMHAYQGVERIKWAGENHWYDAVIPNAIDPADFEFSAIKDSYFLFLGRVGAGKGVHIAIQVCEEIGARLVLAGAGELHGQEQRTSKPISDYVEHVGLVGPEKRKSLLSGAKGLLAPSTFLEPFCGTQIEAMLSGTPVVSSDWGAFAEYNIEGVTGYRCRTFDQFCRAAESVGKIDPFACRRWAENFSPDKIADRYDRYFTDVAAIFGGKGWYERSAVAL